MKNNKKETVCPICKNSKIVKVLNMDDIINTLKDIFRDIKIL